MSNLDIDFVRLCLDEAYERLKEEYVKTSVLSVIREYVPKNITDLECWALFYAITNFQVSVTKHLIPMLRGLLKEIESNSLKFTDLIHDYELAKNILTSFRWRNNVGFKHRFIKVEHIIGLLKGLSDLLKDFKSIGEYVKLLYEKAVQESPKEPLEHVIKNFAKTLREYVSRHISNNSIINLLVPDPSGQSAFKRLCLYFRWMVRPYPDLGIWNFIDRRYLYVSLDEGIARVLSRVFNIRIPALKWDYVKYVTSILRKINPNDPAKYDYVLSRPAIMGYCTRKIEKSLCVYQHSAYRVN